MSDSYGPYEVVAQVATGSTGTVYRARHSSLDRDAAIKELSAGLRQLPGFVERFRAEAETLAGLDHPNVVAVYDYVEEPDRAWIAEEWVEGASLEAMLTSHGRMTPEQSLGVMRGALMGLAHAHDRGLVHRDVAPGNILADRAGTSKLVDFGLAAPVGDTTSQGTPAFISPEAARGDRVGKSSDVYSAAAVLFALLSGRPPFGAADVATMLQRHMEEEAPALSGHGPELADLLRRSMEKDPALRPPDAGAFLGELEQAAQRRFGAGWLSQASIAGLVAATAAGAGAGAMAGGVTAGQAVGASTSILDVAASGALGAAAAKAPKAGLLGLSATAVAAIAVVAVVALGGGAVAAVKLTSSGADGPKRSRSLSPAAIASAQAAKLTASAPIGIYNLRTVLVSSTYAGDKVGSVTEQAVAISLKCTATSCAGKSAAGTAADAWDGTQLTLAANPPETASGLCVDDVGKPVPGSHYKRTTTTVTSPLRPTTAASASGPPRALAGTADIKSTYSELRGRCRNRVDAAHYTVTLTRK